MNDVKFTGAIEDQSAGLYYMNARFYNPTSGRFISQDSYSGSPSEPWTQHLYSYTCNNPVNMIDPTGHLPRNIVSDDSGHYVNVKSNGQNTFYNCDSQIADTKDRIKKYNNLRKGTDFIYISEPVIKNYDYGVTITTQKIYFQGGKAALATINKLSGSCDAGDYDDISGYVTDSIMEFFSSTANVNGIATAFTIQNLCANQVAKNMYKKCANFIIYSNSDRICIILTHITNPRDDGYEYLDDQVDVSNW